MELMAISNNYPPSIAYNGSTMSKQEVMIYLATIVQLKKELEQICEESIERQGRISALRLEEQRRPVIMPICMKPTGLNAIIGKKRKKYQQWLANEPEREKEKQQREKEENRRIAEVQRKLKTEIQTDVANTSKMKEMTDRYKELMLQQVIAPDYRKDGIPEILLNYLLNGRAHTLTDAINLYHEERHRGIMIELEEQRRAEVALAAEKIQMLAKQQIEIQSQKMELQRKQMEDIRQEATRARKELENIRFYHELERLSRS